MIQLDLLLVMERGSLELVVEGDTLELLVMIVVNVLELAVEGGTVELGDNRTD